MNALRRDADAKFLCEHLIVGKIFLHVFSLARTQHDVNVVWEWMVGNPVIPNLNTSCGGAAFVAEL